MIQHGTNNMAIYDYNKILDDEEKKKQESTINYNNLIDSTEYQKDYFSQLQPSQKAAVEVKVEEQAKEPSFFEKAVEGTKSFVSTIGQKAKEFFTKEESTKPDLKTDVISEQFKSLTGKKDEGLYLAGDGTGKSLGEALKTENVFLDDKGEVTSPKLDAIKQFQEAAIDQNILVAEQAIQDIRTEREKIRQEAFGIMQEQGINTQSDYVADIYSHFSQNNPFLPIPGINKLFQGKSKDKLDRLEELLKAKRELDLAESSWKDVADRELYDDKFFTPFKDQLRKAVKLFDFEAEKLIPFGGSIDTLLDDKAFSDAIKKQKSGESLTPYESAVLQKKTAQGAKGMSFEKPFGVTVAEGLVQMPTYGIEFALTGGLFSTASKGVAGAKALSKVPTFVSKSLGALAGVTTQTAIGFSPKVLSQSAEFAVGNIDLVRTEDGKYVWESLDENGDFETALLKNLPKGFAHTFVEVQVSESEPCYTT